MNASQSMIFAFSQLVATMTPVQQQNLSGNIVVILANLARIDEALYVPPPPPATNPAVVKK